jgi:uncharacterized protein YceK
MKSAGDRASKGLACAVGERGLIVSSGSMFRLPYLGKRLRQNRIDGEKANRCRQQPSPMRIVRLILFAIYVLAISSASVFSGCASTRHIEGIHQSPAPGQKRSTTQKLGDAFGWLCINTIETLAQSGAQF